MLDDSITMIDGGSTKLGELKGKVVLLVNVASKCGYTPQYEGLQSLYSDRKDDGLVVLGVPCNDFAGQEPGDASEIQSFCTTNYGVDFPMTDKVSILGNDAHPVYKSLRHMDKPIGGDVRWNFTKFLIGKDGKVIGRYEPDTKPDSRVLTADINAALAQN